MFVDHLTQPHLIEYHWIHSDPLIEQAQVQANEQIAVNYLTFATLEETEV